MVGWSAKQPDSQTRYPRSAHQIPPGTGVKAQSTTSQRARTLDASRLIAEARGWFLQVSVAGDDGFLYRAAQVLPQVKAVGHLDGVRGSLAGAL